MGQVPHLLQVKAELEALQLDPARDLAGHPCSKHARLPSCPGNPGAQHAGLLDKRCTERCGLSNVLSVSLGPQDGLECIEWHR